MFPGEFGHLPEYRGVTGNPQGVNGPYWALVGERRRRPGGGRTPQAQSELGGGRPPFLPSLFLFLLLLLQLGKGGNLLLLGVGLPLGRAIERDVPPRLPSFIYGGGGNPIDTTIDP